MRVVVTGAGGKVGACTVDALARRHEVSEVVGLVPGHSPPAAGKVRWLSAELLTASLEPIFARADAVVHLDWAIQPSSGAARLEQMNVEGSHRIFEATAAAGVPKLVYGSSVGAYAPAPRDRLVDETWPIGGVEGSLYSRHRAAVEVRLDTFERQMPGTRIVRLRPAAIFGGAQREKRDLLRESLLLNLIFRGSLVPRIQLRNGLRFQAIHSSDLALAYALAVTRDVGGAFNLAAAPLLDDERLSAAIEGRRISLPRRLAEQNWRMRLRPNPPDWMDLAMDLPLVSSERAERELGWRPRVSATEALTEQLGSPNGANRARRDEARRRLIARLTEVAAIEREGIAQLRRGVTLAGEDRLARIFEDHLTESEAQERRLRERLDALGAGCGASGAPPGGVTVEAFAAARPQRPDGLTALAFAYQHMEIAAYELLREAAEAVGDQETAALASEHLIEEQAMAGRLASGFDLAIDAALNGSGDSAGALLDRCLVRAHAIEREGLHLLETAPRIVADATLRQRFSEHLDESREHEAIVCERLQARGLATARAEDAPLRLVGMQLGACLAAEPDTTARLIGFARSYDHLEIAAYELLGRAARRTGDGKVLAAAERILAEERAAAGRLMGRSDKD